MNPKQLLFAGWEFLKANGTKLLAGGAVAGVVITAITSAKAMQRAMDEIRNKSVRGVADDIPDKELIKIYARCFVVPVLIGGVTCFCIVSGEILNAKKQAELAAAFVAASESYRAYRTENIIQNGPEADQKIIDAMESTYMTDPDYGISYNGGMMGNDYDEGSLSTTEPIVIFEPDSGIKFRATRAVFENARYHLNRNFQLRGYAGLDEFRSFLGIGPEVVPFSKHDDKGWGCEYVSEMQDGFWLDILLVKRPHTEEYEIEYELEPIDHYDDL